MDAALMAEFADEVTILPGNAVVMGIFEDPAIGGSLKSGGHVVASQGYVFIRDEDAEGIDYKSELIVIGKRWKVVAPPHRDGTGMTKFILGKANEQQSEQPDIRY